MDWARPTSTRKSQAGFSPSVRPSPHLLPVATNAFPVTVCRPATSAILTTSATNLLNRIAIYTANSATGPSSALLAATDFFNQLELLGAKKALLSSPKVKAEAMDIWEDSMNVDLDGEELMEKERSRSVTRMLRVVRDLAVTLCVELAFAFWLRN